MSEAGGESLVHMTDAELAAKSDEYIDARLEALDRLEASYHRVMDHRTKGEVKWVRLRLQREKERRTTSTD